MAINFERAKKLALKSLKSPYLECLILGPSGAGKSYSIGTLGVNTLYLYSTRESHGPKAASVTAQDNLYPICFDYGYWEDEKEPRAFTDDESLTYLQETLRNFTWIKEQKFKAIAVDGLAALETIVKGTTLWREKCKTTKGAHNTFKEVEASQEVLGSVINELKAAQRECDVHLVMTGIIDVRETDPYGGVVEAAPKLQGFGLAESINQHFGDIVVTGKMTRNGETKYKFQFMTDLTKVSKDEHGNQKRAMNFSPRLSGITVEEPIMEANLAALAAIKAKGVK